jgi:hypothetical protein
MVQQFLNAQPPDHLILSAALPARKATLQLSAKRRNAVAHLLCPAANITYTWNLPSFDDAASVWIREGSTGKSASGSQVCNVTVVDTDVHDTSTTIGRVGLGVPTTFVSSKWAEFVDLLTLEKGVPNGKGGGEGGGGEGGGEGEGEGDRFRSTAYGTIEVADLQRQLCCTSSEWGNASNSSADPAIVSYAAEVFMFRRASNPSFPAFIPSWIVSEHAQVTLVAAAMKWGGIGPYTNASTVYLRGVPCKVVWTSPNGYLLTFITPSTDELCNGTYNTMNCGYLPLRVEVPSMLGLALDDEVTSLGTTVECPPVCPGAQPPDTETAPVEEGDDIVLRYVHVLADYSVVPVSPSSTSSIGLYFTSRCTASGFADIPTEVCLNASHPGHTLCLFGAGSSCRLCPNGALCPGGFRAWPLSGYYTVSEATGTVVKCPVPESRCNGWDASTGTVRCGVGYRLGGYMCMSCENGFYASHDGTCAPCPASVNMSGAVIISMLTFLAYMLAGLGVLYGVCLAVLKVGGGSFLNVRSSFVSLIIWTFTTLQTVAQLGKLATHGMPSDLHAVYQALLVFQFEGASIPAACTGQDPLLTQLYSCVGILAVICTLTVTYAACALLPHVAALLRSWRFTTVLLRTLTLSLSVAAAPLSITLLQVLVCRIDHIPVHTYLGMLQDGRALQNAGIVLSALPTRAQLETLLEVPILVSDTSQVCYESTHALVYPLVFCTIVVYFVLYPILVSWVVSSTLDKLQPHTSINGAAGHSRSFGGLCQRAMLCCCGRQLLERLRASYRTRRWHCCIGCAYTSDVYSNVDGAEAKSQTRQGDVDAALRDPLLSPYIKAQYSPSFIWFMVVESCLQLLLATVGAGWKYTNGPMESGTKAALLCAGMLGAAWLYETRQPLSSWAKLENPREGSLSSGMQHGSH